MPMRALRSDRARCREQGRRDAQLPSCHSSRMLIHLDLKTQNGRLPLPSTVFDSALFRDMFGTAEMRAVFSDEALVGRYLETEAALARAQARAGVVPQSAAEAISAAAQAVVIDFDKLRRETEIGGYPILPLVHQLSEVTSEAGTCQHWGATTRDIIDIA